MKLTDKEAIRLVKRVRSYDLEDSIENAPQDEVKVCDLQFVADVADCICQLACFGEVVYG